MADDKPYTVFVARPSTDAYDGRYQPTAQPRAADIDPTFLDAMKVRHSVFILEQKVPLESELDEDDPRSCHWVAYLGGAGAPKEPVGTLRAVPYPQPPHPTPGAAYSIIDGVVVLKGRYVQKTGAGPATAAAMLPPTIDTPADQLEFVPAAAGDAEDAEDAEDASTADRATSLHDGREPYIKLGRIAVLATLRGHRLGQFLVQTALDWIRANPTYFDDAAAAAAAGARPGEPEAPRFRGLVCVHAQAYAAGFYTKLGFAVDEAMGTWWEEGMQHVGMFLRLDLGQRPGGPQTA